MSKLYRDSGVVLRTHKFGEADRIIVVLTEHHGKVRCVAKGVRKGSSKFGGRLEPLSNVALLLREGRQLDQISQVETVDHFRALRNDLSLLAAGSALVEAIDLVSEERQPNQRLYQMAVGALRTLSAGLSPLFLPSFHLKLLAADGVQPRIDECVSCASLGPLVAFDVSQGGALCQSCRRGLPLSSNALALLRRVLGGDLVGALSEAESPATHEVELIALRSFEHHVERRLRVVPSLITEH